MPFHLPHGTGKLAISPNSVVFMVSDLTVYVAPSMSSVQTFHILHRPIEDAPKSLSHNDLSL